MGILGNSKAKDTDSDMDRFNTLEMKLSDGSITDDERNELMTMRARMSGNGS